MAGERIADRYELEQEVGRGGMGVVYRARDLRLNRTVALKMLPGDLTKDSELRRRLALEARAASSLSHPGIATVYDFEDHAGGSFIVYEYVEGPTLREQLRRPRFTTEGILDVGMQLADALVAAHERGIVHRDLKPENIIMKPDPTSSGRVKILDFGLAKMKAPLSPARSSGGNTAKTAEISTASNLIVGTVNYMSPEQLEREPVDARTDIYALGLVLYEMAAGTNPFVGSTDASTIANILKEEPAPLRERNTAAPAELDRILRKCLRKRREERYQSARELWVDLSNLRRELAASGDRAASAAVAPPSPAPPLTISRGLARALLVCIQVGYLIMYGIVSYFLNELARAMYGSRFLITLVLLTALCGTPVRLYLLSATVFDYSDLGRQFRRLFPALLFLDAVWATSPTLVMQKLSGLSLVCVAGLAYLPFSQRTLVFTAYAPGGGRTSAIKSPSAV